MQRYRKRQQNIQLSRRRGRDREGAGRRRGGTKPQAAFCMAPESPPVKWLDSEGWIWERLTSQRPTAHLVCTYNGLQNDSTKAISSTPLIFAPCSNFSFKALTLWKSLLFKLHRVGGVRPVGLELFRYFLVFPWPWLCLKTFIYPLRRQGEIAYLLLSPSEPQKNPKNLSCKHNKMLLNLTIAIITSLPTDSSFSFQLFLQNPDIKVGSIQIVKKMLF